MWVLWSNKQALLPAHVLSFNAAIVDVIITTWEYLLFNVKKHKKHKKPLACSSTYDIHK